MQGSCKGEEERGEWKREGTMEGICRGGRKVMEEEV